MAPLDATTTKKARKDSQTSSAAGEFLTAGKLFKMDLQVGVTYGNAKAIDLFVMNPKSGKKWAVQVKTLRERNCFPARKEEIGAEDIWVFVILNRPGAAEDFYIVPGSVLLADIDHFFGNSYCRTPPSSFPAINLGPLAPYKDKWEVFLG